MARGIRVNLENKGGVAILEILVPGAVHFILVGISQPSVFMPFLVSQISVRAAWHLVAQQAIIMMPYGVERHVTIIEAARQVKGAISVVKSIATYINISGIVEVDATFYPG